MNATDLKPGVYQLTKNVANPEKDKRVKRDWTKAPQWNQGDRFIVRFDHGSVQAKMAEPFREVIREGGTYSHHRITEFSPGFLPLIQAMEPTEETLDTIMTGQDYLAYRVLDQLVTEGKLSLVDVKETLGKIG